MRCVICRGEIERGEGVAVPSFHDGEAKRVHKQCLLKKVALLAEDPHWRGLLEYLIEYEEKQAPNKWAVDVSDSTADACWERDEVNLKPNEIKKLLESGIIGCIFHSRSTKCYALTGRELIKDFLSRTSSPTFTDESERPKIDASIFEPVIGYEDVKDLLVRLVNSRERIHALFIGPPATAKTIMLACLEAALGPHCYYATGSRTTGPGLTEVFTMYNPLVCIIDEIDKVGKDALAVLLSVMESGRVIETKHRRHNIVDVDTRVIGACNTDRFMPPELISRFKPYVLYFSPYSRDEYISICEKYLSKYENLEPDLARYLAERVYDEFHERDVRFARGIARALREKTREAIDRELEFIKKYRR
ncbi:minichromosome maintenance protein MCM [bacterium]|nr:minichromosome maintenance protein MCM [bacterium]